MQNSPMRANAAETLVLLASKTDAQTDQEWKKVFALIVYLARDPFWRTRMRDAVDRANNVDTLKVLSDWLFSANARRADLKQRSVDISDKLAAPFQTYGITIAGTAVLALASGVLDKSWWTIPVYGLAFAALCTVSRMIASKRARDYGLDESAIANMSDLVSQTITERTPAT